MTQSHLHIGDNQKYPPPINNVTIIDHTVRLYKLWQEYLPQFPKTSRYSLGAKIDTTLIEFASLLLTASRTAKERKLPYLHRAGMQLDAVKFLLRIAWEIRSIDNKKYIDISKGLDEIGKMLGGWTKQSENKIPR